MQLTEEMRERLRETLKKLAPEMEQQLELIQGRQKALVGLLASWNLHPADGMALLLDVAISLAVRTKDGIAPVMALDAVGKLFAEKLRLAGDSMVALGKIKEQGRDPDTVPMSEVMDLVSEERVEQLFDLHVRGAGDDVAADKVAAKVDEAARPQRTILVGKLARYKVCGCGHALVKEEIPLGTEYRLLSDTVQERELICGGCGKRQMISVAQVVEYCGDCGGEHKQGVMPLNCLDFGERAS